MIESELSKSQILAHVPLFSELKSFPQALDFLASLMTQKKFEQGHLLLQEGHLGDEFFILLEGRVAIKKKTPEGDIYKVAILTHESHPALGEGGLIEAEPRSATVEVEIPSAFLVLNRENFLKFSAEHPEWAVPILKKIAGALMGRLRQTSQDLMLLHKALMHEVRG